MKMPRRKAKKRKSSRYDAAFYRIVPTAIFGLAGVFYLAVPSEIITASGLGFGETAKGHVIFGLVFLIIAAIFWLVNNRGRK